MSRGNIEPEDADASFNQAKRRFGLNLALFICLAGIATFIFAPTDVIPTEPNEAQPPLEEPLALTEEARLVGRVLGLSEHPSTLPKYEIEWVMKLSEKLVRRSPHLTEATAEDLPDLAKAFFEGYSETFHDYYDDTLARELGYETGGKFNPSLRLVMALPDTYLDLTSYRKKLEALYGLEDEAEWLLFNRSFQTGFRDGYFVVVEGVTVQSRRDWISLFD